jgi:hypothetical protein
MQTYRALSAHTMTITELECKPSTACLHHDAAQHGNNDFDIIADLGDKIESQEHTSQRNAPLAHVMYTTGDTYTSSSLHFVKYLEVCKGLIFWTILGAIVMTFAILLSVFIRMYLFE